MLLSLTRQELGKSAISAGEELSFNYCGDHYHMDWRVTEERNCYFYRPDHPSAEKIIAAAKARALPPAEANNKLRYENM
jgi:hypothetical protein